MYFLEWETTVLYFRVLFIVVYFLSYIAPDGTEVVVKYVADENGFQSQSDLLPVAPAFPHPMPQFVLDQIASAAEEDARRVRDDSFERPSARYGAP